MVQLIQVAWCPALGGLLCSGTVRTVPMGPVGAAPSSFRAHPLCSLSLFAALGCRLVVAGTDGMSVSCSAHSPPIKPLQYKQCIRTDGKVCVCLALS